MTPGSHARRLCTGSLVRSLLCINFNASHQALWPKFIPSNRPSKGGCDTRPFLGLRYDKDAPTSGVTSFCPTSSNDHHRYGLTPWIGDHHCLH